MTITPSFSFEEDIYMPDAQWLRTLRRFAREAVIFTLFGPVAVFAWRTAVDIWYAPKSLHPQIEQKMVYQKGENNKNGTTKKDERAMELQWINPPSQHQDRQYKARYFYQYQLEAQVCFKRDVGGNVTTDDPVSVICYIPTSNKALPGYSFSNGTVRFSEPVESWIEDPNFPDISLPSALKNGVTFEVDASDVPSVGLHTVLAGTDLYVQSYAGDWLLFKNGKSLSFVSLTRTTNKTPLLAYIEFHDNFLFALIFGWPFGFGVWLAYRILRFAVKG